MFACARLQYQFFYAHGPPRIITHSRHLLFPRVVSAYHLLRTSRLPHALIFWSSLLFGLGWKDRRIGVDGEAQPIRCSAKSAGCFQIGGEPERVLFPTHLSSPRVDKWHSTLWVTFVCAMLQYLFVLVHDITEANAKCFSRIKTQRRHLLPHLSFILFPFCFGCRMRLVFEVRFCRGLNG